MRRAATAAALAVASCAHPAPQAPRHAAPHLALLAHEEAEAGMVAMPTTTTLGGHGSVEEQAGSHRGERGVVPEPRSGPDTRHTQSPARRLIALVSTAYCLTGRMANGQRTYDGAVAANRWPLGTRLRVRELGRVFTVADRIGWGSELDLAMPGRCAAARRWGRRVVHVEVVA